jgi:hypothetical protein
MEPAHNALLGDWLHAFVHGTRVRSGPTYEHQLQQSTNTSLFRGGKPIALEDVIDQLDEVRDVALLHSAKYRQALRGYHECNVRAREFQVGDLVLRRVQGSKDRHKLSPPWEGPFMIYQVLQPGTLRSDTRTDGSFPTRGTLNTCGHLPLSNYSNLINR